MIILDRTCACLTAISPWTLHFILISIGSLIFLLQQLCHINLKTYAHSPSVDTLYHISTYIIYSIVRFCVQFWRLANSDMEYVS